MTVTAEEIYRAAHLARLKIEAQNIPQYIQHLDNFSAMVQPIITIETQHTEPMAHPLEGQQQALREDRITTVNERTLFQRLAPQAAEGLYLVPQVIE